jgi:hypothetical protein
MINLVGQEGIPNLGYNCVTYQTAGTAEWSGPMRLIATVQDVDSHTRNNERGYHFRDAYGTTDDFTLLYQHDVFKNFMERTQIPRLTCSIQLRIEGSPVLRVKIKSC